MITKFKNLISHPLLLFIGGLCFIASCNTGDPDDEDPDKDPDENPNTELIAEIGDWSYVSEIPLNIALQMSNGLQGFDLVGV